MAVMLQTRIKNALEVTLVYTIILMVYNTDVLSKTRLGKQKKKEKKSKLLGVIYNSLWIDFKPPTLPFQLSRIYKKLLPQLGTGCGTFRIWFHWQDRKRVDSGMPHRPFITKI